MEDPLLHEIYCPQVFAETSGVGGELLLLIHGLGANGAVWDPLLPYIQKNWKGSYVVPDLPGHGKSAQSEVYSFGTFAAALAPLLINADCIAIIGHSLGGALGALLATGWFGVNIDMVLALSVKTVWGGEELQKFREISHKPVRWMDNADDAAKRFSVTSGLASFAHLGSRVVERGVTEERGKYRFSTDPRVIGSTGPNVGTLIRAAACPVYFGTGAKDGLAPIDQMTPFDKSAASIAEAGHNVHVERPEEVWDLFQRRWDPLAAEKKSSLLTRE
jgi:pimeloyl-ACP methyl ester carboxylesterase